MSSTPERYPGFTEDRQPWRQIVGKRCLGCGGRVWRFRRYIVFGVQSMPTMHSRCGGNARYSMWTKYNRLRRERGQHR